ncbi:V-type proton ATPase subunit E [Chlamydia trachomatis]|uniref:V-type proton ATPase subunit E n=2 Tax=Chlamydia trachomatis TaxID=813 RepID=VATE_CHLT2|nr:V-type ATP synthase subunit E [Chlamydia trachomatis]B0B7M6.1 RecName: Full=V-type proton ATPase subunit E; AltName: Full=V-ATPase subunit E [Chlamydia trachomatis 434/Bu]B0BBU1.1 RecName: Full=V-type proton ATPase subunit E; AltName: Full=V-ATPase subunit E [Chlamydia trachomatis L2b/UCH-1/proctitis]AEJ77842.1 V-type ATP synthase subunit E [Chlamydia trachomatis L2c]AGJ64665.1 ATP synthase subunit E [Chlamydia trachomatis L2/434/Bu(i)]AGJ65606.1 ATP synthase subunit E [Chlamydia trachomati
MADLSAQDKLKQICDALREETLKPAEEEAGSIVHNAREQAKRIVEEAKEEAQRIIRSAEETADQTLKKGEAALVQAGKRSLENLKQAVETKIFRESLGEWLDHVATDPEVSAKLVQALVQAVDAQGISGNLSAYIGKHVSARAVNEALGKEITSKLKEKGVSVGKFSGGAQLKVEERNWVLDMSSEVLLDLLTRFLQKDFREMIFQSC